MAPIDSSIDSSNLSFEEQNSGKNKARKRKHDGIEFAEEHELPNGILIGYCFPHWLLMLQLMPLVIVFDFV